MPWPVFLLFLLPLALAAYLAARTGGRLRMTVILGVLAGLVGATLAVVLMGVV